MYQKNPLLEFTAVELGLVPAITTPLGAGVGAIVGDITGRIKSRKIEDQDEKKKNIKKYRNKGIKYGALGGLGVGLTPAAVLVGGSALDKLKQKSSKFRRQQNNILKSYFRRSRDISDPWELNHLANELRGEISSGKVSRDAGESAIKIILAGV